MANWEVHKALFEILDRTAEDYEISDTIWAKKAGLVRPRLSDFRGNKPGRSFTFNVFHRLSTALREIIGDKGFMAAINKHANTILDKEFETPDDLSKFALFLMKGGSIIDRAIEKESKWDEIFKAIESVLDE